MGAVNTWSVVWPPKGLERQWTWQVWDGDRVVQSGRSKFYLIAALRGWVAQRRVQALYAAGDGIHRSHLDPSPGSIAE